MMPEKRALRRSFTWKRKGRTVITGVPIGTPLQRIKYRKVEPASEQSQEPIEGKTKQGVKVDKGLVKLVELVNSLGYDTIASCSGMKRDHPNQPEYSSDVGYLSFILPKQNKEEFIEKITSAAGQSGLEAELEEIYLVIPCITVRIPKLNVPDSLKIVERLRLEANRIAGLDIGSKDFLEKLDVRDELEAKFIKERYGGRLELSDAEVASRWKRFGEVLAG